MSEETNAETLTDARVITRHGISGASADRRRIFQRHLLSYLTICLGVIGLDLVIVQPEGLQWAWWVVVPWTLVFSVHFLGLKARGYSFGELFVPPRTPKVTEEYPVPLDFGLVRARQIRDGIDSAASSVAKLHPVAARESLEVSDALVTAIEKITLDARSARYRSDEQALRLVPKLDEAVASLEDLHEGLLAVELLEESAEDLPIQEIRELVESLMAIPE